MTLECEIYQIPASWLEVIDPWNVNYRYFIMEENVICENEQINELKTFFDKNVDIE